MGRCTRCDAEWHEDVARTWPQAKKRKANLTIVFETHYEATGHYAFVVDTIHSEPVSVAKVPDPNQLRLADDPDNAHLDPVNWGLKS